MVTEGRLELAFEADDVQLDRLSLRQALPPLKWRFLFRFLQSTPLHLDRKGANSDRECIATIPMFSN